MCFKPDRSENLSCHYPLSVAASLSPPSLSLSLSRALSPFFSMSQFCLVPASLPFPFPPSFSYVRRARY